MKRLVLMMSVALLSLLLWQPSVLFAQTDNLSLQKEEVRLKGLYDDFDNAGGGYSSDEADEKYQLFERALEELLMSNNQTFYYSFPLLEEIGLTIIESEDKKIRIYNFYRPTSGSMQSVFNAHQYECGARVYTRIGSICGTEEYAERMASSDEDVSGGGYAEKIYTFPINGKVYYIVEGLFVADSRTSLPSLSAFSVSEGNLERAYIFKGKGGEYGRSLSLWYDSVDWYYRAGNSQRYSWIMAFESSSSSFYVPVSADEDSGVLTDRYDKYSLSDSSFDYAGTEGGYWLNPSLREFISLETLFTTKRYIVRIDKIKEGVYRYASWKRTKTMADDPDITLTGNYNAAKDQFSFTGNGKIWYYIKRGDYGECELVVQQGSKVLLRESSESQN